MSTDRANPLRMIRQVEIAVESTDSGGDALGRALGLQTVWEYTLDGMLHMRALRAGQTFLELVKPVVPTAPPARFIARWGPGLYFLVLESSRERDNYALELLRRRVVLSGVWEDDQYRLLWIHPKAATGTLLELGEVTSPDNPWTGGAGEGREQWYKQPSQGDVTQLRHAVIVVRDLEGATSRWKYLFGMRPTWTDSQNGMRRAVLPLAAADTLIELRQPTDAGSEEATFLTSRGEGLFSVLLEADVEAVANRLGERNTRPLRLPYPSLDGLEVDPTATAGARIEIAQTTKTYWPFSMETSGIGDGERNEGAVVGAN